MFVPGTFNSERKPLIVGSNCAGSVRFYAAMLTAQRVLIDADEQHLPLRHSHHRYVILGPNGPQTLTVPLVGETDAMTVPMRDVRISNHGKWRHLHWGALYSSYGKTPYFHYFAPDLERIIVHGQQDFLLDFNEQIHNAIVDFADLPIMAHTTSGALPADALDLRRKIAGKRPDTLPITNVPYYQLWSQRFGFTPGLSILDLIMNTGRESIFTLLKMTDTTTIDI